MTGTRIPSASMSTRTAAASSGDRTNERATRSTPRRRAKRRSSTSLSVRAGALTATPGRFMPLWSRMVPPRVTTHSTSVRTGAAPADGQDPQFYRPVGQEDRVAGADVVGEGGVARRQPLGVPVASVTLITSRAPPASTAAPPRSRPIRSFGPWRSARMPTARPAASDAARTWRRRRRAPPGRRGRS